MGGYFYKDLNTEELYTLFKRCTEIDYQHAENSASFAIEKSGRNLYIYLEKSNGIEDWMNNLDYHSAACRIDDWDFYCHEGFWRVFESLLEAMNSEIQDVFSGIYESIYIVGYSHGAALAFLLYGYLTKKLSSPDRNRLHKKKPALYGRGFGCPRVIWGENGEALRIFKDFITIRNIDDIVTHLPPGFTGYKSYGRLVKIGAQGRYTPSDAHRAESYLKELSQWSAT